MSDQFIPTTPENWVQFFEQVIDVAEATGKHPDLVTLELYTRDVKAMLGTLPTPPWYAE